jgi:DNA-binding MarR family transcriptional regulator
MTAETRDRTETEADLDGQIPAVAAPDQHVALRDGLGFRLGRVARGLRQSWAEDLHPLGTTPPQVAVARGVAETPGCSLRALARVLGTDPTNAKRCVDELRQRGLLTSKDRTGDRRPLGLALTDAGHAFVGEVEHLVRMQEERIQGALGPSGCRELADALGKLEHLLGLDGDADQLRDAHRRHAGSGEPGVDDRDDVREHDTDEHDTDDEETR